MGEGWSRGIRVVLLVLSGALVLGGLYWKGREILDSDPSYNFDVLGYVACALALDGLDDTAIRDQTYAAVDASAPKRVAQDLKTREPYRRQIFRDPALFAQQRQFYQGRIGYVAAVWLAWKAGIPLGQAPGVVSVAAWVSAVLLAFVWLARRLPPWLLAPVVLVLALSRPLIGAASTASPDMLLAVVLLLGFALWVEVRGIAGEVAGLTVLALAAFVRADAAMVGAGVAGVLMLLRLGRDWRAWVPWMGVAGGFVGLGALVRWLFDARPWWVVLTFTTRTRRADVDALPQDVDLSVYWEILEHSLGGRWGSTVATHVALSLVLAFGLLRLDVGGPGRLGEARKLGGILLGVASTQVVRFFLFPRDWDRLVAPWLLLMELLLVTGMVVIISRITRPESRPVA